MFGMDELYRTYKNDLFRYLVSLTHDPSAAEDLLSETFLQALQSLQSFRGQATEKTWLFGIARNVWLQSLRSKMRGRTVEYSDMLGLYLEDTLTDAVANKALLHRIGELLGQADERSRTVLTLRVQGLPYAEIAEKCGISEGSARVIDFRTKQKLKETLKKEGLL